MLAVNVVMYRTEWMRKEAQDGANSHHDVCLATNVSVFAELFMFHR
jgi:hypothetical protein